MAAKQNFICACFFTRNYFIPQVSMHVNFIDASHFIEEYLEPLREKGCSEQDVEGIVSELLKEKERRMSLGAASKRRKELISAKYRPLHPHVYTLQKSFLQDSFLSLVEMSQREDATTADIKDKLKKENAPEVYSLPVFTERFCADLMEELEKFDRSDLPKGRPNTMNNFGILLNELGFDDGLISPLREHYLKPLCRLLYPDWVGPTLDSHKAFVVNYRPEGDLDLDYHYDNAEVTLNVSLGKEFSEGSLYFGNMWDEDPTESFAEVKHRPTYGVLHRGRHRHGAMPIAEGERWNLIVWLRSSAVRAAQCPMCGAAPRLERTDGEGDGFAPPPGVDVCALV